LIINRLENFLICNPSVILVHDIINISNLRNTFSGFCINNLSIWTSSTFFLFHIPNIIWIKTINTIICGWVIIRLIKWAFIDFSLIINQIYIRFNKILISPITKNPIISIRVTYKKSICKFHFFSTSWAQKLLDSF